jgi:hypothetical protein
MSEGELYSRDELRKIAPTFRMPAQVEAFLDVVHHSPDRPMTRHEIVNAIEFYGEHLGDALVGEMIAGFRGRIDECRLEAESC